MTWILIALMVVSLFMIPLGLPGLWIMVAVAIFGVVTGEIGVLSLGLVVVLAGIAELIEFFIVKRMTTQYGGSRKAFWGALAGGLAGVIVGAPIPIIGSIIAGMIGTFIGAGLVTYAETKQMGQANRVGFGAVVGRGLSAATKTFAGLVILVITAAALIR